MHPPRPSVKQIINGPSGSATSHVVDKLRTLRARESFADRMDIRNKLRSRASAGVAPNYIDTLLLEYLSSVPGEPLLSPPSDYDETDIFLRMLDLDGVLCPLCARGFLAIPIPGVLTCDSCSELQLRLPSDDMQLSDVANAFDTVIRSHAGCGQRYFFHLDSQRTKLVYSCPPCGSVDILI